MKLENSQTPISRRSRICVANYPCDSNLNIFGDYHALVCELTESNKQGVSPTERWGLVSYTGAPTKHLEDNDVKIALKNLFFAKGSWQS